MYWKDTGIKLVDFIRAQCRYPGPMLGRCWPSTRVHTARRILVMASHPDDEAIGLGGILAGHALAGDALTVVFSTNGRGRQWQHFTKTHRRQVQTRMDESRRALSVLGLNENHLIFLGFPDHGLTRYLPEFSNDVARIFAHCRPHRTYVQGFEGGHPDHDATSLVVQLTAHSMGIRHLWEWAEYNQDYPLSQSVNRFPRLSQSLWKSFPVRLTADQWRIKRQMLSLYRSQNEAGLAMDRNEVVRRACPPALFTLIQWHYPARNRYREPLEDFWRKFPPPLLQELNSPANRPSGRDRQ